MTRAEWLTKVRDNAAVLGEYINKYHPRSKSYSPARLEITAPNVEVARLEVVGGIGLGMHNPVNAFNVALRDADVTEICQILDQTWFGVPESTECWRIPGFKISVDLIDDMPEDMD